MCLDLPSYTRWLIWSPEKVSQIWAFSIWRLRSIQLNYVLFHIYISLMKAILFDFHWDLQALCQQWVSISYYGVSELPFILLAKLQG